MRHISLLTRTAALLTTCTILLLPTAGSLTSAQVLPSQSRNAGAATEIISVAVGSGTTTTPNACNTVVSGCTTRILGIMNADRSRYGLPKLVLTTAQSTGSTKCVGSYGHSVAMARSSAIWHINARYPRASFPTSICVPFLHAGENVGESASGNAKGDLKVLDNLMMSEPHSRSDCATTVNHACNILNPLFHKVGIGVYYINGATWLTEDFTN